jgi:predicted permease
VLLAAMPAGSTTSVLAEQYKADVAFASKVVVLTTLGSIILLPAWVYLLQVI